MSAEYKKICEAAIAAAAQAYPPTTYLHDWGTRQAAFENGFRAGAQYASAPAGPVTCAECHLTIPAGDYHYTFESEPGQKPEVKYGPLCAPCVRNRAKWPDGEFKIVQHP